MRVAIPHTLGKAEVRRRLETRTGELAGFIPGGAGVEIDWIDEDHMALGITAMKSFVGADLTIEERQLIVEIELPMALKLFKSSIEQAVRDKGRKLLT